MVRTFYEYRPSMHRSPVIAKQMVATSQPLAAQAGLKILLEGGNAVDAAIATASTLTVVEPTMNGIGSDAFAMVYKNGNLFGLNASGKSPATWNPKRFSNFSQLPTEGWESVTVPGAVSGWVTLSKRFGKLPFEQVLRPAIEFARQGFHVSPIVAYQWELQSSRFVGNSNFVEAFMPNGHAPKAGDLFLSKTQGDSLEKIANSHGQAFYVGELAEKIVTDSHAHGSALSHDDLAKHEAHWIEPMKTKYKNCELCELPPNGQGIAALIALGILDEFDLENLGDNTAQSIHIQVEAMKLALSDVYSYISDLNSMPFEPFLMLDKEYLKKRAQMIDLNNSSSFKCGDLGGSNTVYLASADRDGMMVSFIQSNYNGFGSGVVVPKTGISLQNRAAGFTLDPDHPNCVDGGKRPFHTIIPGFLFLENSQPMSFGVMGADMQPQGHVQIVVKVVDFNYDVQAAAGAPRWKITKDNHLNIEEGMNSAAVDGLLKKGHKVRMLPYGSLEFGAAQLIKNIDGGYVGGSEPRRDGLIAGY